jgi:hypothetical protein
MKIASRLGIYTKQVKSWRAAGLLRAHRCNDKLEYLYEDAGPHPPREGQRREIIDRRPALGNV